MRTMKKTSSRRSSGRLAVCLLAACLAAPLARAETWTGFGDGVNWEDPANWNHNELPRFGGSNAEGEAFIGNGDEVNLSSTQNINMVRLGAGANRSGTLNILAGTVLDAGSGANQASRLGSSAGGKGSDDMVTPEGLEAVAGYANGIGLNISRLFDRAGRPVDEFALVRAAQARGLVVYPYTARADDLPAFAATFEDLLGKILFEAGADGVFTDHPGRAVDFLRARGAAARSRPESTESAE